MHSESELRRMFEEIAALSRGMGVPVQFRARVTEAEILGVFGGLFEPNLNARHPRAVGEPPIGWISVYRQHCAIPEGAMEELLTIAHEFGHAESFKRGLRGDGYLEAANKVTQGNFAALSERERCLVLSEERRAWRFGRENLAHAGFDDWSAYWQRRARALRDYLRRFEAGVP